MTTTKTELSGARTHIEFNPIPSVTGTGKTCLSIYPPGQFIKNAGFAVFIGGGGVGERDTLKDAKAYLLDRAKKECRRRIEEAQAEAAHYATQLEQLESKGLTGEHREAN